VIGTDEAELRLVRSLQERLAAFRAAHPAPEDRTPRPARHSSELAERLAAAIDGQVIRGPEGAYVRRELAAAFLPVDRERLAALPGQPPPNAPLVCLDIETTGLATAAGTLAFVVGIGRWDGDHFRQVGLLLADQPDEPALLTALRAEIPDDAWLVTYNGRGFDWPLLVARYRMARRDAPVHDGHLDLLPIVRRVLRHRMADARLRTVESSILGLTRHEDVEGWEIPSRYLEFLRTGDPHGVLEVLRHNEEDVRSLARLLGHIDRAYGDPTERAAAHPGDLAGLARLFARGGRLAEALACLEAALDRPPWGEDVPRDPFGRTSWTGAGDDQDPWWTRSYRPHFGGRARRPERAPIDDRQASPWSRRRVGIERARLLRRIGRHREAAIAWAEIAAGGGPIGVVAWTEVAKLREHRLGEPEAALAAVRSACRLAERSRALGRPLPRVEQDLAIRGGRLAARLTKATRALGNRAVLAQPRPLR
jgi:tetratricopeptide (TPR) repeat protein